MSFSRAWVLIFALFPIAWAFREWRRRARQTPVVMKALSILCGVLALSGPELRFSTARMAVALLVDTSESVADSDLSRASQLVSALEAAKGRNWLRVIPFARSTFPEQGQRGGSSLLRRASGEAAQATDIEAALRDALATMPAELVRRVVVVSDGKENRGSISRGAELFRQLRIPIDTIAMAGRLQPEVAVDSVTMPIAAYTGEQFAIDLVVRSPRRLAGVVEIAADGKLLGSSPVAIEAGTHPLRVYASVSEPGVTGLTGTVRVEGVAVGRFSHALDLRRPKLLYVSEDAAGTGTHLLEALRAARFEIDESQDALQPELERYQLVVLNNQDIESLPLTRKQEFEDFVKQGGGLLIIGGENNVYPERDRTEEDPLDRVMPAKIAPPLSPEVRCVVLVLDKSASMTQGGKIDLARVSAVGVIENLRPTDMVGVIIFDHSFRWLVPISPVGDRARLERLVSGVTADGGTNIPPALEDAYAQIAPLAAAYKHIVLLTDGLSDEGNSYNVARQAAAQNVTISTIGLGTSINKRFLMNIATYSNGSSYFLDDPAGLEQVLLHDVREHTQTTTVEKDVSATVLGKVELLDGVQMESAPPLNGYVRYKAKPAAETILQVDGDAPLLARWQYELGRSVVFASDAKSRWASRWVSWRGFDRFWANVARDLLPRARAGEAGVVYDGANGELVVEYRLGPQVAEPSAVPEMFVFGPSEFRRPVEMRKVAARSYRGRVAVGDLQGLFRVRPLVESRAFPETGLYLAVDELREYGNDEALLRRLAESTGGRFNPQPRAVFEAQGRSVASAVSLWPGLLGMALFLNLLELAIRKWPGVRESLRTARQQNP